MDINQIAKKLDGLHTVETVSKQLNISKRTAINYISLLRKEGYLTTTRGHKKKRLYDISPIKMRLEGSLGLYETINKYSKIKLAMPYKTVIHERKITVEEAIIEAIKTGNYRVIIAAIPLFNHITDWALLSKLAKKSNIQNKVGALYELARRIVKTKRMDKRTEKSLEKYRKKAYLIEGLVKEKEFKDIGKKWNVVIGLTKADLERLKE
jgi:biotin operon repressor